MGLRKFIAYEDEDFNFIVFATTAAAQFTNRYC